MSKNTAFTNRALATPYIPARSRHVALALPFLDAMVHRRSTAHGAGCSARPISRLGFVYVPNGVIPKGVAAENGRQRAIEIAFDHEAARSASATKILVLSNLVQNGGRSLWVMARETTRALERPGSLEIHPKKTEGADIHAGVSVDQLAAQEF